MIKQIIDLHIHSKYSRACSRDLELPKIAVACGRKGVDICATGDFTHPAWFSHIKDCLEEVGGSGLYRLKDTSPPARLASESVAGRPPPPYQGEGEREVKFILSTEISCIYKHKDATRRLHLVILAPNLAAVEKFNEKLVDLGCNIRSDGRPIVGLSGKEILRILLDIDKRFMLIPAHAWTPWFSVFGSKSGYDSLEECFEELTPHIKAIETGLSSDPTMNRRLSALDNITLVSNSDAHSPDKIGREANVVNFENEDDITYGEITRIISTGDKNKFLYTIEFFPEEGKYHFDGHAPCAVCLAPEESKKEHYLCPKCKKKLTIGVLSRVEELADRAEKNIVKENYIPHKYIVPLRQIIASVFGVGEGSKRVAAEYESIIKKIGNEFFTLIDAPTEEIKKEATDENIALAIANMRAGKILVFPGFDGVFGRFDLLSNKTKLAPNQGRLWRE